jgi:sRNA-binding regulator protein Hfq
MLEANKPIYQRAKPAQRASQPTQTPATVKISKEEIDRKQLQHNEDWLFERRSQPVRVTFLDGEKMVGTVNRIRKFTFVIDTEEHGSVLVYKLGVKYVCEVK